MFIVCTPHITTTFQEKYQQAIITYKRFGRNMGTLDINELVAFNGL